MWFRVLLGSLFLTFASSFAFAEDSLYGHDAEDGIQSDIANDIEEWRFQEDSYEIPDYPDMNDLLPVDIDAAGTPFEYFIDPKALVLGADGVTRYTIAIRGRTGHYNVMFEALRCDTREYKTYAYGTTKKTFYTSDKAKWRLVPPSRGTGADYRDQLVTVYFCNTQRYPLAKDEIIRRIKYAPRLPDDSTYF